MTAAFRLILPKTIAILIFIAAASLLQPIFAQDTATPSTTRREKIQEKVQTRKENLTQRIETKRENVENRITAMKERMASREAALKVKLDTFKDRRKAAVAGKVNTNLNTINQNHTTQMQKHLDKMSELLAKLETRVNQGSPAVKDPVAASAAIAESRVAIASASSAVAAQAEKDYTIQVTVEAKVREDAQKVRESLRTDLTSLRQLVITAKQSVSHAIRVAKSGPVPKEGTPSGQQ